MQNGTYSFIDVTASITGPGGSFDLGYGSANAKEGITITRTQDRNNMIIGADGSAMHSLRADRSGSVTVRLLKTSNRNAMLQNMFNAQSIDASLWGQNLISISHKTLKDKAVCSSCAFLRDPDMAYAEDGDIVEWTFQCGQIDIIRGSL